MTDQTTAILNMLEKEEDIKFDLLDRFVHRDLLDLDVYAETVSDLAFVLEDELRASIRHHYIDVSMWSDIVLPYIENADYKEIADTWLSSIRRRRENHDQ